MRPARLLSYTPDHEGVVLARLSAAGGSRYVEVATDPARSAGRTLADAGWSGVIVDKSGRACERPGAEVVRSVDDVADADHIDVLISGTGSDVLGAATRLRASVVVCDAQAHLVAYRLVLRLGDTGVFVRDDLEASVADLLSAAPSSLDDWEPAELAQARQDRDELAAVAMRWRSLALSKWPGEQPAVEVSSRAELDAIHGQLEAVYATLSWRVTAPLRMVRRRLPGSAR